MIIVKAADPLTSVCGVAAPPSTLSDTLPVGIPDVELTVTVTAPFVPNEIAGALIDVVVAARFTVRLPDVEL